jgi:hypothetical protein
VLIISNDDYSDTAVHASHLPPAAGTARRSLKSGSVTVSKSFSIGHGAKVVKKEEAPAPAPKKEEKKEEKEEEKEEKPKECKCVCEAPKEEEKEEKEEPKKEEPKKEEKKVVVVKAAHPHPWFGK